MNAQENPMAAKAGSEADLTRFERKLDKLAEAVSKLILLEERQITQAARLAAAEARVGICEDGIRETDKKVDKWINRGIGVWAIVGCAFTVLFAVVPRLFK